MEGIHGVDVSWLHHSQKGRHSHRGHELSRSTTLTLWEIKVNNDCLSDHHTQAAVHTNTTPQRTEENEDTVASLPQHDHQPVLNSLGPSEAPIPQSQHHLHMPHILSRASSSSGKFPQSSQLSPPLSKDAKLSPPASSSRRNSWISSLSSKFSSTPNSPPPIHLSATASAAKTATVPLVEQSNPFGAAFTPGPKDARKQEAAAVQNLQLNKSSHPSFIQNALRKFSSSGVGSLGKVAGSGGVIERKTMNIDPYRPRCGIPGLEPAKLRRVAFCVDVEIAGPAKYIEEEEEETKFPAGKSSQAQQEQARRKKVTDETLKSSEGEDLQITATKAKETAKDGVITVSSEELERPPSTVPTGSETKEPTRKREKKKRSEEERKARKEHKRNEALANGEVIADLWREGSSGSSPESPAGVETPPKPQDRPTTDPLRIYRRCCQLRETSILKRITEQIALPSACPVATPGILSLLDLSTYWMQLVDLVTLSDYLAVVPVKRLILENCGLGDEAVRVILAGLLAVKTPEQAKHNKKLSKKCIGPTRDRAEQLGVIEKLSLKNNPNIGREGWRYIAYFMNMSRSLKAIDLSMIPCPQMPTPAGNFTSSAKVSKNSNSAEIASLLQKAISEKLGGSSLEELVMAECNLDTDSIEKIVAGVIHCGVTRLGLASNNLTSEGLAHVLRYLRTGKCQGLDLGGNDLRDSTQMLADSLDENNALYALSLADCKLSPKSLEALLPALVRLPNFRFIDLSHNHHLFDSKANALGLLRKYIPQFPILKRIHLLDVAMSSEQAIALAEVLPESPSLAHLNILENQPLSEVASAKDEASQEEACALYASLMAAVRVSSTIICIDIDVPGKDSSEVVKALAKQVVAYSLRNLERISLAENTETGMATTVDSLASEKQVHVPDILMHLVGHEDGVAENHDNDEPAPDDDYIVGGTGVVKALGVCLNRAADHRKSRSIGDSGTVTPIQHFQEIEGNEESKGRAKEMSKNLLASARKIRVRLIPALIKEAKSGDMMNYSKWPAKFRVGLSLKFLSERLEFLDSTLERMIQRFENEYPETRLTSSLHTTACQSSLLANPSFSNAPHHSPTESSIETAETADADVESESEETIRVPMQRHGSDVSLASRQAQEEGRVHKFGQRMRRDILRPETLDYAHGTTGQEIEASHLQALRSRLENLKGEEIRHKLHTLGPDAILEAIGATADELRALENDDPKEFKRARMAARSNMEKNLPVTLSKDVT